MRTDSVKLRPGDRLEEGDQIYVASAQVWHTVKKGDTVWGMVVGTNSNCRRPVSRPVTNPITNDAAGEWEEETEDGLTSEEELENELAEANQQIKKLVEENMELHNRLQRMQEHVDSLKKQLAALEEKLKAQEKTNSAVIKSAEQERTRLITERDNLRQEVYDLQHSLAVERQRLQSLDVGSAERNTAQGSLLRYEKKIAELQQRLQVSEEGRLRLLHTDSVSAEQPETELERKAWELFSRIPKVTVGYSFAAAETWIAERDRRRKESGK